jgi:hypothetical protein
MLFGFALIAHAQSTAQAVVEAAAGAAVQAAANSVSQNAPSAMTLLTSTGFLGAMATAYGAIGMIISGLTRLFGLGKNSSNATVQKISSGVVSTLQHVAGAPDLTAAPTLPKGS